MKHFIYTLSDPRTRIVRYVGKTNNPTVRFAMHRCEKCGTHKNNWLGQLKSLGLRPIMDVIEEVTSETWQERERFWILHFRQLGFPLTNLDSGGNSGKEMAEETKAKIRAKALGRKQTPESIAKIKATKAAGWTPERRAKMGAHLKSKKQSSELIAKRAAAMKGHVVSEETRRKIGAANKANYSSLEIRAEMRERNLKQFANSPRFVASNS